MIKREMKLMSMMGIVFLTHRRIKQRDLIPLKITLKHQYVLEQLDKNDYLIPSQVADMLFCDRPTASVVIKNMERDGWLRREKDSKNGKQVNIFITDEGRKKLKEIQGMRAVGEPEYDPTDILNQDEKKQLRVLLKKIIENLREN